MLVGAALAPALHAQSTTFSGTVALSSQLVDRGQALTRDTPVLQGAASWTVPAGWALGLAASAEVHSSSHLVGALAHVSRYWSLSGDWQMQASLFYYRYSGTARARAYDRVETGIDWTYRDVLTLGVSAIHVIGAKSDRPRGAADLTVHWPLAGQLSLSAGVGVAQLLASPYQRYRCRCADAGRDNDRDDRNDFYGYGQVGLLWSSGPWQVELDRLAADPAIRRQGDDLGASPWVATVSRSF
ncbi:MAG: hypothetical protein EPN49_10755 [Rhodanobacter sp.]|nr:MAG: hypothetical protein EPN49_10755 [Rhodanobacter sp.]